MVTFFRCAASGFPSGECELLRTCHCDRKEAHRGATAALHGRFGDEIKEVGRHRDAVTERDMISTWFLRENSRDPRWIGWIGHSL